MYSIWDDWIFLPYYESLVFEIRCVEIIYWRIFYDFCFLFVDLIVTVTFAAGFLSNIDLIVPLKFLYDCADR